ncbi:hypothetical protein NBT05_08465 [Aquimarina sp. ERC-38]|uniref:hypothetical protein n=1 Tax=Aquimarina sp. ERC-38 TaxID=2949996 RepID=UPI0022470CF7|nr:hypothetical protein [Aquimarina sp. ERC-38]UZO82495.1 hypothetical protein NBT05_08465 [Aquimarina sp. ERC-38]
MRYVYIFAMAMVLTSVQYVTGQEQIPNPINQLKEEKDQVVQSEKAILKNKVAAINNRLAKNEISKAEAQRQKELLAKKHALNIENKLNILDSKIALLERNGLAYPLNEELTIDEIQKDSVTTTKQNTIVFNFGNKKEKKVKYDRRTTNHIVIGVGFNNAIANGQSINDLDYKLAGSRFFELGWMWSTRVFKNTNFLRLNYGLSYSSEGLKPTDNRYFVRRDGITALEGFRVNLDKSKFRLDNFIIPVHFEIGTSRFIQEEDRIRYNTSHQFKLGIGGFIGTNISTRQKLKYKEDGEDIKDKIKTDYNTNDFLYGVSSYIGFGDTSVYLKYTLSPIFQDQEIDQNNISLGVRFDL